MKRALLPLNKWRKAQTHQSQMLALLSCGALSLTGCVIAGVSSGGGFFIWPGSIGLLVIILIAVFGLRRK